MLMLIVRTCFWPIVNTGKLQRKDHLWAKIERLKGDGVQCARLIAIIISCEFHWKNYYDRPVYMQIAFNVSCRNKLAIITGCTVENAVQFVWLTTDQSVALCAHSSSCSLMSLAEISWGEVGRSAMSSKFREPEICSQRKKGMKEGREKYLKSYVVKGEN